MIASTLSQQGPVNIMKSDREEEGGRGYGIHTEMLTKELPRQRIKKARSNEPRFLSSTASRY
jgi:hypothetical protein